MLLLFRLIVVAVALAAYGGEPTAVGQAHYSTNACGASAAPCGDISDVHYPFFLADSFTTDGTTYSYCGYPGMEVTCQGGRATMLLNSVSYTVLDINYSKHTVTAVDTDVLNGGECPRVTRNVTVPAETTWLDLSATDNDNLAFFFDCVFATGTPTPVGIRPINCSSFPQRDGVSYVARQTDVRAQDEWPRACKEVVVVPVLTKGSGKYLPCLNSGGYGQVLKQGFQLSWEPSRGPCYLCRQSGGQCSYNQSTEFLRCLCPEDGRVLDQERLECGKSFIIPPFHPYLYSWGLGVQILALGKYSSTSAFKCFRRQI
jgi:hypothetical protein